MSKAPEKFFNTNRFKSLALWEADQEHQEGIEHRKVKRETHRIFDPLWEFLPVNERQKQKYRTTLYKVWGAVMAGELGSVEGVRDPRKGEQHIGAMSDEQCEKCQQFVIYLLRTHKNLNTIAAHLTNWARDSDATMKGRSDQSLHLSLDQDKFIREIRNEIGLGASPSMIAERKSPAALIEKKSSAARVELTAANHYVEGMVAKVRGDNDDMIAHLQAACDKNHAEAAWSLYKFYDSTAIDQEEKDKALSYLDKAMHGAYVPALVKVKKLYKEGITTPYVRDMEAAAAQNNAPVEVMHNLAEYYQEWLGDIVKAESLYKDIIRNYPDGHGSAWLRDFYFNNRKLFFTPEEECRVYQEAMIAQEAHHPMVGILLLMKEGESRPEDGGKVFKKAMNIYRRAAEQGDKVTEFQSHIFLLSHSNFAEQTEIDETVRYLSAVAGKFTGSTGNDSAYNIDIRTTQSNQLMVNCFVQAIEKLAAYHKGKAEYYSKQRLPRKLESSRREAEYWQEYQRWVGDGAEKQEYDIVKVPGLVKRVTGCDASQIGYSDKGYITAKITFATEEKIAALKEKLLGYSIISEPEGTDLYMGPITYAELSRLEEAETISTMVKTIAKCDAVEVRSTKEGYCAVQVSFPEEQQAVELAEKLAECNVRSVREGKNLYIRPLTYAMFKTGCDKLYREALIQKFAGSKSLVGKEPANPVPSSSAVPGGKR